MRRVSRGRFAQIYLRKAWVSEASGFTPWLASEAKRLLPKRLRGKIRVTDAGKKIEAAP
jgi:hypothetical protein